MHIFIRRYSYIISYQFNALSGPIWSNLFTLQSPGHWLSQSMSCVCCEAGCNIVRWSIWRVFLHLQHVIKSHHVSSLLCMVWISHTILGPKKSSWQAWNRLMSGFTKTITYGLWEGCLANRREVNCLYISCQPGFTNITTWLQLISPDDSCHHRIYGLDIISFVTCPSWQSQSVNPFFI